MLSALANGGQLLKPKIIKEAAGFSPDVQPLSAFSAQDYFAKEELNALGIQFPLFTAVQPRSPLPDTTKQTTEVRRNVALTSPIRSTLLEGMNRVVWGTKGTARPSIIKGLLNNPTWMRNYLSLQNQMVGKTSTAEFLYNPHFCPSSLPQMYKHVWFGSITFGQTVFRDPEIVVVVFLRYGDSGKEAAALAAQVICKWREIKEKYK
jgi:cell division protein FtsI/penicillin-binding protein 2